MWAHLLGRVLGGTEGSPVGGVQAPDWELFSACHLPNLLNNLRILQCQGCYVKNKRKGDFSLRIFLFNLEENLDEASYKKIVLNAQGHKTITTILKSFSF